jgi:hypothetical protein
MTALAGRGSGNFIADFETPNRASGSDSGDEQTIAQALSAGGHATTQIPAEPGQQILPVGHWRVLMGRRYQKPVI